MTKIQEVVNTIETLALKAEMIDSLAYVLWDSMANKCEEPKPGVYSNGVLMLSDQINALKKELREAFQTLHQSVKEIKV